MIVFYRFPICIHMPACPDNMQIDFSGIIFPQIILVQRLYQDIRTVHRIKCCNYPQVYRIVIRFFLVFG